MKKTMMIAALAVLPLGLTGCDKKPDANHAEVSPDAMGNMAMPERSKMGKGTGTVAAVDAASGKITLDHGAIAELGWPAMKMGFAADKAMIEGVKVGDKLAFEIEWDGKAGKIVKITPAP